MHTRSGLSASDVILYDLNTDLTNATSYKLKGLHTTQTRAAFLFDPYDKTTHLPDLKIEDHKMAQEELIKYGGIISRLREKVLENAENQKPVGFDQEEELKANENLNSLSMQRRYTPKRESGQVRRSKTRLCYVDPVLHRRTLKKNELSSEVARLIVKEF